MITKQNNSETFRKLNTFVYKDFYLIFLVVKIFRAFITLNFVSSHFLYKQDITVHAK